MSRVWLVVWMFVLAMSANAQACPRADPAGPLIESAPVTIKGRVVFHDDLRQWLSLNLAKPICGSRVIQLLEGAGGFHVGEENSKALERFRGCKATVSGTLGLPGTGYYSAELYMNVDDLKPESTFVLKAPFPDYSAAKPTPGLTSYRVAMNIAPGGHLTGAAYHRSRKLSPWQAYASHFLTGSFAFAASCADGFRIGRVWGTPAAGPQHLFEPGSDEDRAVIDVEIPHGGPIKLNFTCLAVRSPQ